MCSLGSRHCEIHTNLQPYRDNSRHNNINHDKTLTLSRQPKNLFNVTSGHASRGMCFWRVRGWKLVPDCRRGWASSLSLFHQDADTPEPKLLHVALFLYQRLFCPIDLRKSGRMEQLSADQAKTNFDPRPLCLFCCIASSYYHLGKMGILAQYRTGMVLVLAAIVQSNIHFVFPTSGVG